MEGTDRWSVGGRQSSDDGSIGFSEWSVKAPPAMLTEERCNPIPVKICMNMNNNTITYEMRGTEPKWRNQKITTKKGKLETWKGPWMVRRMWDQKEEVAVQCLKQWTHKMRKDEATPETVKALNEMKEEDALWYLLNLKWKEQYIQGKGKNQITMTGVVTMLNTFNRHKVEILVDSGCTGSCINKRFVKEHNLNTRTLD